MTIAAKNSESELRSAAEFHGPLFVLSVWRSGSSLLYTLLNQHSKIALMYEGDLPRLHRFLSGHFRSGAWRDRWEFWNRGPSRHGIAIDSMPADAVNCWEATRIVYQAMAYRKNATIWGEKTPHWYDCPLRMAENFPDARFIFLWRDPHAIMASIFRAAITDRFFRKRGFTQKILIGSEKLRLACEALKFQGRRVHELNYEDLTSNSSACLQEICRFLDLSFEKQMVTLEGADRSAIASGEHHAMVRSNHITVEKNREPLLPPAIRRKISRYVSRWRLRSKNQWPQYPHELSRDARLPSLIELSSDRILYQTALFRDRLAAVIYALVPLGVAYRLRACIRLFGQKAKSAQLST